MAGMRVGCGTAGPQWWGCTNTHWRKVAGRTAAQPFIIDTPHLRPRLPSCCRLSSSIASSPSPASSSSSSASSSAEHDPFPLPAAPNASPYEVFHLPRNSTAADIKSRYYDLVKIYHPDRAVSRTNASSSSRGKSRALSADEAHDQFKRIRAAYTLLSSKPHRTLYDRSGAGWDPGEASHTGPVWQGGFPTSREQWAAYERWSETVRRAGPTARRQSGVHVDPEWSFGFNPNGATNRRAEPYYTSNARFIVAIASLAASLAVVQYARIQQERRIIIGADDLRHLDAAQNLTQARKFGRSDAGRVQMAMARRKAREEDIAEEVERLAATGTAHLHPALLPAPAPASPVGGRGGSSGKEAYQERLRRLEARGSL